MRANGELIITLYACDCDHLRLHHHSQINHLLDQCKKLPAESLHLQGPHSGLH